MRYRDEREGMQLRIEELEGQLAEAQQHVARLRGEQAEVQADSERNWFTGHAPRTHLRRQLDVEINDEGYEAIAELLRTRLPRGQVSQVGRTLTYRWGEFEVRLGRAEGGVSEIVIKGTHGSGLTLLLGGMGLGTMSGPMAAGAALGVGLPNFAAAIITGIAIIGTVLGLRGLIVRNIDKQLTQLHGVMEAIADVAAKHPVPKKRTRIAVTNEDAAAEAEAEALEEAAKEQQV